MLCIISPPIARLAAKLQTHKQSFRCSSSLACNLLPGRIFIYQQQHIAFFLRKFLCNTFGDFIKFTWCTNQIYILLSSELRKHKRHNHFIDIILRNDEQIQSKFCRLGSTRVLVIYISNSHRNKIYCKATALATGRSHCLCTPVIKWKSINNSKFIFERHKYSDG